ncbi:MAG TPA: alternative ribosome rescue aminoacyl-tRNA hydrolase ArfB [Acidimicrobiales bacterium]|nr:alternative ribosome rescue aminoacyl-tRNA hydrolase ArfB [Acidimicrobiales bacterium]
MPEAEAPEDPPAPSRLRVTRHLAIALEELEWRFTTSGGPGGQHANKASTRAEVRFDVARSPSLGPRQRARLLERLGPTASASAGDERSQARNRALALERLAVRLAEALAVPTPRRPTRPTAASKARRLEAKRKRSSTKAHRSRPGPED